MTNVLGVISIFGIYLVFSNGIDYVFKDLSFKLKDIFSVAEKTTFKKHIQKIFMIISKDNMEKSDEKIFYALSVVIFFVSMYFLIKGIDNKLLAILLTLILTFFPYLFIRVSLVAKQRTASFEGKALLKELLIQYKLSEGNIITTLTETARNLNDAPITRRALFRLALQAPKVSSNPDKANEVLDEFYYSLKTNLSKNLIHNFYSALIERIDVQAGIEDLLENCKRIDKNLEENKRGNLESLGMIKYLAPCFILMFAKMGSETIPINKMLQYQFGTSTGLKIFCFLVIISALNNVIIKILTMPKYDI